jgi:hypothetical protein
VERLLRRMGLAGAVRGKTVRTTIRDVRRLVLSGLLAIFALLLTGLAKACHLLGAMTCTVRASGQNLTWPNPAVRQAYLIYSAWREWWRKFATRCGCHADLRFRVPPVTP